MPDGLTIARMIEHFRKSTGWACEPDTRITSELTDFANKRAGSQRNIDELHVIFCISIGIEPYQKENAE